MLENRADDSLHDSEKDYIGRSTITLSGQDGSQTSVTLYQDGTTLVEETLPDGTRLTPLKGLMPDESDR